MNVSSFFQSLDRMKEYIRDMSANHKFILNGEHYATDREVASKLKVCQRNNNGYIGYFQTKHLYIFPKLHTLPFSFIVNIYMSGYGHIVVV